jgi:hypothetical protein
MSDREEFLAGERPEDVFMYFAEEGINGVEALENVGERVEDGIVLVVDGDSGRSAFQRAVGVDPMAFAKEAMGTDGEVFADCTGGVCPASDGDEEGHDAEFVFAFAEEQNEDVEGLYAEGDVIHAYVQCACGQAYSEKWLADEK